MSLAFALTLCAGVVVGLLGSRLPQKSDRPSYFGDQLGLTSEQSDQMKAIWSDFQKGRQEIGDKRRKLDQERADAVVALMSEAEKAKYEAIQKDYQQKMQDLGHERDTAYEAAVKKTKEILTPEQQSKWDAMQQKRKNDHHGPGPDGHGGEGRGGEGHGGDGHDGFHRGGPASMSMGVGAPPATLPAR
jgi:cell division protein ZapA (FtsZ GTPase activity inhibitor)